MYTNSKFFQYAVKQTDPEPELLNKIRLICPEKSKHLLSGVYQGRLLGFISKIVRPKKILEIGTFIGYSGLCLIEGLKENGILYTIEKNRNLKDVIEKNFSKTSKTTELLIGDAKKIIPKLELKEKFDLIFIDANKKSYLDYYNLVFDKLNEEGIIIIDNVWFKGMVLSDDQEKNDKRLAKIGKSMAEFNEYIKNDERVDKIFLPIRDGLYLLRKI
jgi:caffeoyl-CoA O-methyltransferase